MREIIFLNGKFLSADEAKVSILDPGFLYGLGLFETMRSFNNKIVYFEEHLRRILDSAGLIGIKSPYSKQKLKEIIKETIKKNGFKGAYVRLTLWKAGISVIVRRHKPHSAQKYKKGFSTCVSGFRQNEDSLLARIKTTSRILYQLSLQEAKNQGFDEAIILNNRGHITEGTKSNIFLVKDKEIFTPALECGCLNGITRRVVFDLARKYRLKLSEINFTIQDLLEADEAFLTNSLMGVMPLESLEREKIGNGKCAKLTKFFIEKYNCLLK